MVGFRNYRFPPRGSHEATAAPQILFSRDCGPRTKTTQASAGLNVTASPTLEVLGLKGLGDWIAETKHERAHCPVLEQKAGIWQP